MSGRKLVSTERRVGDADRKRYGQAWQDVRDAVVRLDGRAWRFESARDPELFVEFLEFTHDPRTDAGVSTALGRLEEFGPGDSKEWLDPAVT